MNFKFYLLFCLGLCFVNFGRSAPFLENPVFSDQSSSLDTLNQPQTFGENYFSKEFSQNEEIDGFLNSSENTDESYSDEEDEESEKFNELTESGVLPIQTEDGVWHYIYLNESLESDESYNYENLSWIYNHNHEKLHGRMFGSKIKDNVIPKLYSRDQPDTPYDLNTISGRDAPFDINHATKVVIHGWLNNAEQEWVIKIKDRYFIDGNYNVILVDWHKYSVREYAYSARKTKDVGVYVGQVLVSLIQSQKIRPEDIHIVGFSLGAHIAGVAAKTVQAQIGKKIARITGLDPARPLFETPILCSKKKRLHKDDALFVDIIHTDRGVLGFKRSLGHADFFPNKGKGIQPGCGLLKNQVCSHLRSYAYYTESINSERFYSTPCDSWRHFVKGKCNGRERLSMGFYLDTFKASGDYYLKTNSKRPFAKG